jgi:large subunit ribosomal protein L15
MNDGKKRKKVSRHRGTHTHGRGAKKKARGSGHRGGVGKAGTGKRADQKKLLKKNKKYFGKRISGKPIKKDIKTMNLGRFLEDFDKYEKIGVVKKNKDIYEVDLKNFKIIGSADIKFKMKISAISFTKGSRKSIEDAGGEIIEKK